MGIGFFFSEAESFRPSSAYITDNNSLSNEAGKCTQTKAIKVNLSQLIQVNSAKKKCQSSEKVAHSKTNEPPFLVKIGLLIHSATRKK